MVLRPYYLPELILFSVSGVMLLALAWRAYRSPAVQRSRWRAAPILLGAIAAGGWLAAGLALQTARVASRFPLPWVFWTRGLALAFACWMIWLFALTLVRGRAEKFRPDRRDFLRWTQAVAVAAPVVLCGFGIARRNELTAREIDVPVPGLPDDLHGLRLVQLSDIHLSPYLSEADLAWAVEMANSFRAHLAVVTGDLITDSKDGLDVCIEHLARLRAEAGVIGCHGNHEIYAGCEEQATSAGLRAGIHFLRQESRVFRFGNAELNVAGVDYQRRHRPYLVGAEALRAPGAVNLLLSHNPDVFPVAARQGYDLTLSGHTHGGQVNVEILSRQINPARYFTPYTYGLYRLGRAAVYVTRGIGTVGIPARFGAPPEVALIRLCAT
ncbi:MAG: metallophosphoesterase [Acidobacteria bacterium]|nr:metallophosphoesterase [Acidobacteriota bacterium]